MTPPEMIALYSTLTGIRYARPSHGMEAQAIDFCRSFTLDELRSVVAYVQREINKGKLDERSLGWRAFFGNYGSGNDFVAFQDRLSMASRTIRLRPEAKPVQVQRKVDDGKIVSILDVAGEPDIEPIRQATVGALSDLRKSMGGQG